MRSGAESTGNITQLSTGFLQLASGSTAQRPAGTNGMIRYNSDNNVFEGFQNGSWVNLTSVGLQTIWIPAAAMKPQRTNGCTNLISLDLGATYPNLNYLSFDPNTQQYAQFSIAMPQSWNQGTITYQVYWSNPTTTTNFGVVWSLAATSIGNNQAIASAFGTAVNITSTGSATANELYMSGVSSAVTVAGTLANNELIYFQFSRVATNASDTLAVASYLIGIDIYYTTNQSID